MDRRKVQEMSDPIESQGFYDSAYSYEIVIGPLELIYMNSPEAYEDLCSSLKSAADAQDVHFTWRKGAIVILSLYEGPLLRVAKRLDLLDQAFKQEKR